MRQALNLQTFLSSLKSFNKVQKIVSTVNRTNTYILFNNYANKANDVIKSTSVNKKVVRN